MINAILLIALGQQPKHHPERWYQEQWCPGVVEYRLDDGTRIDCMTPTHAIEVDFARKWYEGIGQALYYAANTARRAGVLLIVETADDAKYVDRCRRTVGHYGLPIDVWEVKP